MPADIFSLLTDNEPTAQEHAAALIAALRGQQSVGQLAQMTGDKVLAPFGQSLEQNSQAQQGQVLQAGEHRLTAAMAGRKLAQETANESAQRMLQKQQIEQTGRYQQGELDARSAALTADAFAPNPATGQLYNKKTGETVDGGTNGKPLHPQDAAKLDAILNGSEAIDHIKSARSSGLLPGIGEYAATLKGEVPALAAADSGTGRASGQNDLLARAPNLYSASGDTMLNTERDRYLNTARDRIAALKQSGYNVAEQEARLSRLAGSAPSAMGAGVRKFTRGADGKLSEVK